MKHTKEPWVCDLRGGCCAIYQKARKEEKNGISQKDDRNIAFSNKNSFLSDDFDGVFWEMDKQTQINFQRIVACVNACAGITTEALENGLINHLLSDAFMRTLNPFTLFPQKKKDMTFLGKPIYEDSFEEEEDGKD